MDHGATERVGKLAKLTRIYRKLVRSPVMVNPPHHTGGNDRQSGSEPQPAKLRPRR